MLSIPQISFFGWFIPIGGLSLTLVLMGLVSTGGLFLLVRAFRYYETQPEVMTDQDEDIVIDDMLEEEIDLIDE